MGFYMSSIVHYGSLRLVNTGVGMLSAIACSQIPRQISQRRFTSSRSSAEGSVANGIRNALWNRSECDLDASHTAKKVSGVVIIPEGFIGVLERFGCFKKELPPGLNIFTPFAHAVRIFPTKQVCLTVEPQKVFTQDNVQVTLEGNLIVQIENPRDAAYKADKPFELTKTHAQAVMLGLAGQKTLEELSSKRIEINQLIVDAVNARAKEYGISCLSYAITSIDVSQATLDEMARMLSSDRLKRETVLIAQGNKEATICSAQAKAEAFEILQKACEKNPEAVAFSLATQSIDAWKGMLGKGNTIVTSTNVNPTENMLSQPFFAKLLPRVIDSEKESAPSGKNRDGTN